MNTPSTTTETLNNLFSNDINPTNNVFFSWNTKKVENGFAAIVTKNTSRLTPNEDGRYVDSEVIRNDVRKTRATAKSHAQKWVRFLKSKA